MMTRWSAALLACIAVSGACAAEEDPPGPPYRAEVLELVATDPETGESSFALVETELDRLDELDRLEGPELRVRRGGELIIQDIKGSIVIGRFEASGRPELRYAVEDGVVIPLDYPTLTMLSAYHQFSRVLDQVEAVAGLSVDEIVSRAGPIEAFFEPRIRVEQGVGTTATVKLNAFYMAETKQFGLAQRAGVEGVPLAANPKVIAHEFGHALFDQLFFDGEQRLCSVEEVADDPLSASRLGAEYAISGFNEGTGDFLSFAMTGSASVLQESVRSDLVEEVAENRSLILDNFVYDELVGSDRPCGSFYCIGTLWARSLYRAMIELGLDTTDAADRAAYARAVLTALDQARASMAEQGLMPAPSELVAGCGGSGGGFDYDGQVTSALLAAILVEMPAEMRPALCGELAERFGESGFSPEARAAACPEGE